MDKRNESVQETGTIAPSFRIWLCGTFRVERRIGTSYEAVRTVEWGGSNYPRLLLKALLCRPGRQARREALGPQWNRRGISVESGWPKSTSDGRCQGGQRRCSACY